MKNLVSKLQQLQSDVFVLNVKFHNYHWNVKGMQFLMVHNYTEKAYDYMMDLFDEFAEKAIQLGGKALICPKEMLELSKVEKVNKDCFDAKEVVSLLIEDYKFLSKEFSDLRKIATEKDCCSVVMICEDNIAKLEKEIWILSSMLA